MRLKHLLSVFLTLLTLSVGQMWGTDPSVTISVSSDSWTSTGTSGSGGTTSVTKSGITVSSTKGYKDGTNHIRDYQNSVITISSSVGNIKSIAFTCTASGTSNNGPSKLSKNNAQDAGSYSYSQYVGTWSFGTGTSNVSSVQLKATAQCRWTQVVVTYVGSDCSKPTVGSSLSSVSSTENSITAIVPISATGGCNITENGLVYSTTASTPTVGGSGCIKETVTACGANAANKSVTISGLNCGTNYYVRGYATNSSGTSYTNVMTRSTSDCPKYTVTLMDDDTELEQATAGASVTLPSRTGCTGYTFEGWTKNWNSAQTEWTTTAPTIIPAGSYTPTADENLYPVYTKTEGASGTKSATLYYEPFGGSASSTAVQSTNVAATTDMFTDPNATVWSHYTFNAASTTSYATNLDGDKMSNGTKILKQTNNTTVTMMEVTGIKITNATNLSLSLYNRRSYTSASLKISYKIDNGSYTAVGGTIAYNSTNDKWKLSNGLTISGTGNSLALKIELVVSGTTNRTMLLDDIKVTGQVPNATTYYISDPNCCESLAQINGSINLSNEDCAAGELKATWKTSSTGLDGIASQTVKVYRADNNNEVTGLTGLTDKTAQTTNQTVTISGLTPCVEYYVKIWNVSKDGSYCESDFAGEKSSNVAAASYTIIKTGVTNVTAESLSAIPATTCASGFNATIVAAAGYDLPSTITVTGANHTWNQATGALTINNVTGDVAITITPTVHTYSITYKDQGGADFSGTQTDAPTSHTYGTATTLKIPTKANNNFGGWFTSVDCTTGAVGDAESATLGETDYTADIVLYAKWVANQHTLTYSEGDAESGSVPAEPTLYDHGDKVDVLSNTGNLTKEHYVFEAWTDGENEYGEGDDFNIYDDVTLSPKWACNEYVDVSKGTPTNGSFELSAMGSRRTCEGEEIISVTPSANTGYAFSAIEVTGVAGAINQTAKTITYAQYAHGASTINVTFAPVVSAITWDLNYQGAPTASYTDYTYAGEALELPAPTRTGYDFVGWFTDPTDGSQIDNVGGSNKPYAATTYYAHWTIKSYVVTWKVAGNDYNAGVTDANDHANYNTTVNVPTAPAASLLGEQGCADTFMGWSKKNGGHDAKAASYYDDLFTTTSPAITEETIFYAVFAKENGGTATATFDPSTQAGLTNNDRTWTHTASGITLQLVGNAGYTKHTETHWQIGYTNGQQTAHYATITAPKTISKIQITLTDEDYKVNSVTNGSLSTSGTSQTITGSFTTTTLYPYVASSGSKQARMSNIVVTYDNTFYSDYVTECAPLTCGAPQSLASTAGKNGATISWSAQEVGTAAKYQYAVWADGEDEPTSGYSETTELTAEVSGLMSNTDYNWKVRTVCTGEDGESEFAKSTFTTGSVALTFSVPAGVSAVAASTSASALPSAGVPSSCADCWVFAGWSSTANATSVEYAAGSTYKFDGDKTLYAVYGRPSNTYKLIDKAADLTANENYVLTYYYNEKEYALSGDVHPSYSSDALGIDVTSKIEEVSGDYYFDSPDAAYVWTFTGSSSSGQLYNADKTKYLRLSETPILHTAGENLKFVVDETEGYWTISYGTSYYLRYYTSSTTPDFDRVTSAPTYSAYIYKRQLGTFTTNPDCNGHTVKWYVIDTETPVQTDNDVTACEGLTSLPDVDVADVRCKTEGTTFMGWSETNVGYVPGDAPTDLFSDAANAPAITADKTFYAVFAEGTQSGTTSKTVKYSVATTSTITTTGIAPSGASAAYSQTYGNAAGQMTKDNSATLTLSDWGTTKITKIVLSMKSNSSSGNGKLRYSIDGGTNYSYLVGSANSGVGFNQAAWNGDWSTSYVDITKDELTITGTNANDIIIQIEATANSLFCESYEITYDVPVYSYADYFTECCPQRAITIADLDETIGTINSDVNLACEDEKVTLSKTENHYNFGSWKVYKSDDESTMVNVTNDQFDMPAYPVTVEAVWTPKEYKLTISDAEGGSATVKESTTYSQDGDGKWIVPYGSTVTLQATPSDEYHYFSNWSLSPAVAEAAISQAEMAISMPGDITATPVFGEITQSALTIGESANYTLTATLANGDPIDDMSAIYSGTSIKVTYELIGQQEFVNWNMNDGAFTSFSTEGNTATFNMPETNLTVDLNVIAYYTLGLSAENGSISAISINGEAQEKVDEYRVHEGETVEVTATANSDTYKFAEWQKTGIEEADFDADGAYALFEVGTSNMTLNAVFTEKVMYNLTLMACGKVQETIEALEGTAIYSLISAKTAQALNGYTFLGWSEIEDGTVISSEALKLNGNTTVYAVYSAEAYYQKVTSTDDITDGQYLIVYEEDEVAFNGGLSTLDAASNTISVSTANKKIAITSETTAAEFAINATAGTIKSASGYYIGQTSDANGLTSNATIAYTNALSIDNGDFVAESSGGAYLRYNSTSGQYRFRYFKSSTYTAQKAIQLYKRVAPGENESNPTTIVANDEELVIDEAMTLNNLTVEAGGKVSAESTLTVNNLTINSEAGKSGQVMNENVTVNGDIYLEIKLDKSGTMDPHKYYCVSAPFDVAALEWGNGTPMVFNVDYQLFIYDGDKRARTGNGWQRVGGTMEKNSAYFIGFDDENTNNQNIIRLKAANKAIPTATSIELKAHSATYGQDESEIAKNSNWNGLGNPRLNYVNLNKNVSVYEAEEERFDTYAEELANGFVVGTAFFVQGTGNLTFNNDAHGAYRAPKRENEHYMYCVEIAQENASRYDNRLYVMASETASSSFEEGKDLPTLNSETSKYGALIWTKNYGMRLAIEDAPLVNGTASYVLTLSAPKAGTYSISVAAPQDNADLYLTYEGSIIWNLSEGAYTMDLNKGITNGYGLILRANAPSAATGIDEAESGKQKAESVQKIILDEKVFILRGGKMYDVTGKAVK